VAVAIGLTAVVTWMLAKAKPIANRATKFAAEILEYAEDERRAESVCKGLTPMLDCILEKTPDREIHILGYSFGAVVAVDYLFPRSSMWPSKDPHTHARARMVRTLSTVGCPLDFIRLYKPDYLAHREPHVRGIPWLNIFIAADVLGSNFHDGDDFKGESPNGTKEPPNGTENPPNGT
jgi:hypothetical protein